jgi:hypothetical protein
VTSNAGEEQRAGEGQSAADVSLSRLEKEAKAKANVASMMFVELLFWKNQKEAEDVREEYNWRVRFFLLSWKSRLETVNPF